MKEEKLKQILNEIGRTEVPPNIASIAEQTSQRFDAALNIVKSQRQTVFFTVFKRVAVAAAVIFAFAIGLSLGQRFKPAQSPYTVAYTAVNRNTESFWQQKAVSAIRPGPFARSVPSFTEMLNDYKQYHKEKHYD